MKRILPFLFLTACATPSHWQLDSIASNEVFESKRLIYIPEENFFGIKLEMIGSRDHLAVYLCSQGRQFGSSETAALTFQFGDEIVQETLPLHQGKMRVRLSDELALKTIHHLKEGKPLTIILDTIEQTIQPEQFSALLKDFGATL